MELKIIEFFSLLCAILAYSTSHHRFYLRSILKFPFSSHTKWPDPISINVIRYKSGLDRQCKAQTDQTSLVLYQVGLYRNKNSFQKLFEYLKSGVLGSWSKVRSKFHQRFYSAYKSVVFRFSYLEDFSFESEVGRWCLACLPEIVRVLLFRLCQFLTSSKIVW